MVESRVEAATEGSAKIKGCQAATTKRNKSRKAKDVE